MARGFAAPDVLELHMSEVGRLWRDLEHLNIGIRVKAEKIFDRRGGIGGKLVCKRRVQPSVSNNSTPFPLSNLPGHFSLP